MESSFIEFSSPVSYLNPFVKDLLFDIERTTHHALPKSNISIEKRIYAVAIISIATIALASLTIGFIVALHHYSQFRSRSSNTNDNDNTKSNQENFIIPEPQLAIPELKFQSITPQLKLQPTIPERQLARLTEIPTEIDLNLAGTTPKSPLLEKPPISFEEMSAAQGPRLVRMKSLMTGYLSEKEVESLEKYYQENMYRWDEEYSQPTKIRRKLTDLPRSFVIIPSSTSEKKKGMYVLLKTHNGMKPVGQGCDNKVTLAVHWDTGEIKAFRSARASVISESEFRVNAELANSDYFAVGIPIKYVGSWRTRDKLVQAAWAKKNKPLVKKRNIEKVGFIMDLEAGDLQQLLDRDKLNPLQNAGKIAQECAKALRELHARGFVHNDLKPENIFLTKSEHVKIGDFGLTVKVGKMTSAGTFGYAAPEYRQNPLGNNPDVMAALEADVFGMGCVFADIFYPKNEWYGSFFVIEWDHITEEEFHNEKYKFFPNQDNPNHHDHIISKCLTLSPQNRPTAEEIVRLWEKYNLEKRIE